MNFPHMRLGIEAKGPPSAPVQVLDADEMRRAIFEASHESSLIRNVLVSADYRGSSAEDRYTMLAYHALVALETYWQRTLELTRMLPNPPFVMKEPI